MEDNEGDLDVLTSLLEEGSPLSNDVDGGDTRVNGDDLHDDGDDAQHSGGPHPPCSNNNGTEAELSALFDAEDNDAEDSDALVIDIGEPEECGDDIRKADGDVPAPRRSAVSTPRCDDGKENVRLEEKSKEELAEELRLMQEKVLRLQQQLQETSPPAASSGVSSQRKVGVKKTEVAKTAHVKTKSRLAHQPKSGGSSAASKDHTKTPTASQAGTCSQSPMSVTASTSAAGGATAGKRKAPTTLSPPTTASSSSSSGMQENTEVEKYSGYRIRRPLISSVDMDRRMAGRRMIRLSQLPDKITRDSLDNIDWVTIGVIVHKHTPQSVSSGKTFSVWRLMDLKNMEVSVSLLLFGEVHKQHWKTDQGSVVGLLNPTLMKPKEGYNELSISVDHPQKVMLMGEAKDLGTCRAAKRNGDPCTQLINLMEGEFCQFHVQSQYRKMSSRRSELQAGFTGREPTMLRGRGRGALGLKERICQQGFHYGGVSSPAYAASVASSTPSKGSKSTQMSLSGFVVRGADAVLLQAKQNLGMVPSSGSVTGCSEDFQGLLKAPTPGALNLKKHLVQTSTTGADGKPRANVQSISAAELIRQQKRGLQDARRKRSEDREAKLLQIADTPSASRHEANPATPTDTTERPVRPEPGGSMSSSPIPLPSTSVRTPRIGSGLRDGDEVFLFDSPPQPNKRASNADRKKLAAVHKLRANGKQLEKQNPNAVKRKVAGETVRAVLQRTEEDTASSPEEQSGQEPASKRARRNSELFNSPEFQQLLAARSKHSDKVRQAEDDLQEQYFNVREKKEQMEEKMKNLKEQKCRVVSCKQCKYTHYKALETCVQQMHTLSWHDGVKRFFRCGQCSHRTVSLDRLPQKHCKNCGQFKWERDSMLKERKGPKIGAETLLPRGEEQAKFLNSLA